MFVVPTEKCDSLIKGDCPLLTRIQEMEEEYIRLIEKQAAQIASLEAKIATLEKKLADSNNDDPSPPPFVKVNRKKGKRRGKPGRKKGHPGSGRKRPDHIDEYIESELNDCPYCLHPLNESDITDTREHIQEDIIPAQVKVTLYRHQYYRCPNCKKKFKTELGKDEIPNAKLGPRVLLTAAFYKHEFRLPYRKITQMLHDTCGLKVSPGALAKGVQRLSGWMQGELEAILQEIRDGPSVNVDESGWRVDGINHYVWAFASRGFSYYRIDKHRSSAIPHEVLGKDYGGVIVSDFYSAYNPLSYVKQKCHVHLLRELHEVAKKNDSEEFRRFKKNLKRLLTISERLAEQRNSLKPADFRKRLNSLETSVRKMAVKTYEDADCKRLAKRLVKHGYELLTFVDSPGIDKDNNRAERAIRPMVVTRKISGGNRSDAGATAHSELMSIIESVKKQGKDWFLYGQEVISNQMSLTSQPVITHN